MSKSLHDKKPWHKPPKWFKRMQKRIRRAKVKASLSNGKEPERERKSDVWDWN